MINISGFLLPIIISPPPIVANVAKSWCWRPMEMLIFAWPIRSWMFKITRCWKPMALIIAWPIRSGIIKIKPVGLSGWTRNRSMTTRTGFWNLSSLISRSWRSSPIIRLWIVFRIIRDPTAPSFHLIAWRVSTFIFPFLLQCPTKITRYRPRLFWLFTFLGDFLLRGW